MDIWENVSMSCCTLLLEILRCNSVLVVLLWMDPHMHAVMIFWGGIDHPCWVSSGVRGHIFLVFLWWPLEIICHCNT